MPLTTLRARYGSILELISKLLGVVPNHYSYLEIWPIGARTANVMVPNFLNLPLLIWGMGAPKGIIGLAMYVSSRTAQCAYCSAHSCSFALRRGARPESIAQASAEEDHPYQPAERAAMAVARSLASVPCRITEAKRKELENHFSPANAEWIVLSISMVGFLNKSMDAAGVELEDTIANEVRGLIGPTGWAPGEHHLAHTPAFDGAVPGADSLWTKLSVVRHAPSALLLDREWIAGAPGRWPRVGAYLGNRTGHDFPVLSRLRHARPIRAIAAIMRDNLGATASVVGLNVKHLAGVIYATVVGNAALANELRKLAEYSQVSSSALDEAAQLAAAQPSRKHSRRCGSR